MHPKEYAFWRGVYLERRGSMNILYTVMRTTNKIIQFQKFINITLHFLFWYVRLSIENRVGVFHAQGEMLIRKLRRIDLLPHRVVVHQRHDVTLFSVSHESHAPVDASQPQHVLLVARVEFLNHTAAHV